MPGNDVDFFTAQFLNDILHPAAFHAHTGAHRIDIGVIGGHRKLGAAAGFPGGSHDIDDPFTYFGNFCFK